MFGLYDDDDGFTADFFGAVEGEVGRVPLRLALRDRLITEQSGLRRTDLSSFELEARLAQNGLLTLKGGVGGVVSGNLYGVEVQENWHRIIHVGRARDRSLYDTLRKTNAPLQSKYPVERRGAATASATLALTRDAHATMQPVAGVESKIALGDTGLSYARAYCGVLGRTELAPGLTLSSEGTFMAGIYATPDPHLTIPGGYVANSLRPTIAWSLGLETRALAVSLSTAIGRDGSANNGGSIAVSVPLP